MSPPHHIVRVVSSQKQLRSSQSAKKVQRRRQSGFTLLRVCLSVFVSGTFHVFERRLWGRDGPAIRGPPSSPTGGALNAHRSSVADIHYGRPSCLLSRNRSSSSLLLALRWLELSVDASVLRTSTHQAHGQAHNSGILTWFLQGCLSSGCVCLQFLVWVQSNLIHYPAKRENANPGAARG